MTRLTLAVDSLAAPVLPAGFAHAARTGIASTVWIGATDTLSLLAIVFALPFVILAVGVPIALTLQALLWLLRLL